MSLNAALIWNKEVWNESASLLLRRPPPNDTGNAVSFEGAKYSNVEEVRKKNANRDGLNYQKEQIKESPAPQGHNCLGAETRNSIKAMEEDDHHRQDYTVRQSIDLFVEIGRSDTHFRR